MTILFLEPLRLGFKKKKLSLTGIWNFINKIPHSTIQYPHNFTIKAYKDSYIMWFIKNSSAIKFYRQNEKMSISIFNLHDCNSIKFKWTARERLSHWPVNAQLKIVDIFDLNLKWMVGKNNLEMKVFFSNFSNLVLDSAFVL